MLEALFDGITIPAFIASLVLFPVLAVGLRDA